MPAQPIPIASAAVERKSIFGNLTIQNMVMLGTMLVALTASYTTLRARLDEHESEISDIRAAATESRKLLEAVNVNVQVLKDRSDHAAKP